MGYLKIIGLPTNSDRLCCICGAIREHHKNYVCAKCETGKIWSHNHTDVFANIAKERRIRLWATGQNRWRHEDGYEND